MRITGNTNNIINIVSSIVVINITTLNTNIMITINYKL